ncbi:addiction module antidote protein, HigA family [Thioalkalicoccus limnaeus]|uniref:Addiction module antidote protein, HigA family n=1 Tax=Thioalkalicoccus limnaeus TaxID=120681 RepID=A0ABV4BEK0_9GAMM
MSIAVESLHACDFSDVAEGDLLPVPPGEILAGRRSITADTGLRLSRFFGMSDGFWIGLQADCDVAKARARLGDALDRIAPFTQHAA